MAKKKAGHSKRIKYGEEIDLVEVLNKIKAELADMPQAEIAARADIRPSYVSELWKGKRSPTMGVLTALASVAGGRIEVTFKKFKKEKNR